MTSISVRQVGFLLRVHRRSEWLPVIFSQMQKLAKGRRAHLVVMADRPSPNVITALAAMERKMPDNFHYTLLECPEPIRTSRGCRWTETMKFMYGRLRRDGGTQAAMMWDDDIIFSDTAFLEIRAHLDFLEVDRVEGDWINIANHSATHYDSGFLTHSGTHLFRIYKEDDWSDILTRTTGGGGTQSPIYVARSTNVSNLTGRIIHMGYCGEDERQEAWNAAKACGQSDGYFRQLNREPTLTKCQGPDELSATLTAHLAVAAAL